MRTNLPAWQAARLKSGYPAKPDSDVLRIYTTRPDTLFGATYMVIAPEHPLVARLTTPDNAASVKEYVDKAATKSDLDRTELAKMKTGVPTGSYAINPVNGEPMPIWIADYVLASYGTGAIMAVPAHDKRDFEFAKIIWPADRAVVDPGAQRTRPIAKHCLPADRRLSRDGIAINSGPYDGLRHRNSKRKSSPIWRPRGLGRAAVNTSSAIGSSAGSGSGASRSRSCTNWTPTESRPARSGLCRWKSCR